MSVPRFITTEPITGKNQDGNQRVWEAIRSAFSKRTSAIGYWRYPLFLNLGNSNKEPDILVIDQEWGIITIEICHATSTEIQLVTNDKIEFIDKNLQPSYSIEAVSQYIKVLRKYCDQAPLRDEESNIQNKVIGKALIAFPNCTSKELQQKLLEQESEFPFICSDQMGEVGLQKRLREAQPQISGESLNDNEYTSLLSIISGTYILRKPLEKVESINQKSRYNILAEAQKYMYQWDAQQEWISKSVPPGPQRVRGIAGSGKTVLFSQKAVIMHLKHPEWKIAFVFFTRSLYDQIENLFKFWIEHFTNGEREYENSKGSNLRIFHAWGAKDRDGFYGELCQIFNKKKLTPKNTGEPNPNRGLAYSCNHFLDNQPDFDPVFDALVIDEGQDLMTEDDLKIKASDGEEKQSIYWLAYKSLKPVDKENPEQKRLIWAYDEAQTIHSQAAVAPEAKEVFGQQLSNIIGGRSGGLYLGGIRKAYDMKCCYRTPGAIVTIAYALGVGLLRTGGILKPERIRRKDLKAIGFETEGDFRKVNQPITITRPQENSPNPIPNIAQEPLVKFGIYDSRQDELLALAKHIEFNFHNDNLNSSRNILVITLGETSPPSYDGNNLERETAKFLMDYGIDIYIPSACMGSIGELRDKCKLNEVKPKYPNNNPDLFWCNGGVTVSRIDRTKGNEADMVYLIGLDNIAKNESDLKLRNQLFVALTRSRAWVSISGIGNYSFYDEVNKVIEQGNHFTFTMSGVTPSEDANDDLVEEEQLNL